MLRRSLGIRALSKNLWPAKSAAYYPEPSRLSLCYGLRGFSKRTKPNYEIYKKNTDMRAVQKQLYITGALGGAGSILAGLGIMGGNFLLTFVAGFLAGKNLYQTQL